MYDDVKPWRCPKCPASFKSRPLLNRHNSSVHEGNKPFVCTLCSKSFPRADSLKIHTRTVHEKQKLFSCSECDMRFSKKQSVERHFLKIHGSGKEQMYKKIAEEIESNSEFYPVEYVHIGEEIKTKNSVGTSHYNAGKFFMIFYI